MNRFAKFGWGVLAYNIAVIVWGAFVRASKSGAGCGDHWPDCNGEVIPFSGNTKTLIEFAHRSTSGLAGIVVIILLIWAFRAFPKRHSVRIGATLSFVFILIEGALGAMLVKKGLVAENDSVARAFVISIHLVNTLILVAFLALTAWWATTRKETGWPLKIAGNFKSAILLCTCLLFIMLLSATGAITALGATLFPVQSISEGLARDLSPTHFLHNLIWIHPVLAVLMGLAISFVVVLLGFTNKNNAITTLAKIQIGLVVFQLLLGGLNLLLHAPVWLQLTHLLSANLIWVTLVLFTSALLTKQSAGITESSDVNQAPRFAPAFSSQK